MKMSKQRVENFSDCVISIIMTIMVLSIPLPETVDLAAVQGLLGSILIFFVSFFVVGSHWHRHALLFSRIEEVSGTMIWRNVLFLFFLSLMPLFTKWIMQHPDRIVPAVCYACLFTLVNLSHQFVFLSASNEFGGGSRQAAAFGTRHGVRFGLLRFLLVFFLFAAVIAMSFFLPTVSIVFFIGVPVASSLLNLLFEGRERPASR